MGHTSNSRVALVWLVSAFGAVAVARFEAHQHPPVAAQVAEPAPAAPPSRQAEALRDGQQIDINAASASELELLPGVGPSLAKRIIEARGRLGGFTEPQHLRQVKGVGEKTLAKLLPYLKFDSEHLEHTRKSELNLGYAGDVAALPKQPRTQVSPDAPAARE